MITSVSKSKKKEQDENKNDYCLSKKVKEQKKLNCAWLLYEILEKINPQTQ